MQPLWGVMTASLGLLLGMVPVADGQEIKFADCPAAVQKTFQAEAQGARIATVTKETDEDEGTIYWAEATVGSRTYAIGVREDGTLHEMSLAVGDEERPLDRCPSAVQATFRSEAFGETVGTVGKDEKYGVTIYETTVVHKGKSYVIVVAEDGTLVEKTLVIDDEEVELAKCPLGVQTTLRAQANGGTIGEITRSTGIGRPTFEAEVQIKDKVYLIEVAENGLLISKSLQAVED